jgi:hypothetical protein
MKMGKHLEEGRRRRRRRRPTFLHGTQEIITTIHSSQAVAICLGQHLTVGRQSNELFLRFKNSGSFCIETYNCLTLKATAQWSPTSHISPHKMHLFS